MFGDEITNVLEDLTPQSSNEARSASVGMFGATRRWNSINRLIETVEAEGFDATKARDLGEAGHFVTAENERGVGVDVPIIFTVAEAA
jgi:hypothetical protein